ATAPLVDESTVAANACDTLRSANARPAKSATTTSAASTTRTTSSLRTLSMVRSNGRSCDSACAGGHAGPHDRGNGKRAAGPSKVRGVLSPPQAAQRRAPEKTPRTSSAAAERARGRMNEAAGLARGGTDAAGRDRRSGAGPTQRGGTDAAGRDRRSGAGPTQ